MAEALVSGGGDFRGFESSNIPANPLNFTQKSLGLGNVILIKPEDEGFFRNPLQVHKNLKSSPFFNIVKPKHVRTNKVKKILAVELELKDKPKIDELLKVDTLGTWKITCYLPSTEIFVHGVISNISEDVDLEELKEEIKIKDELIDMETTKLVNLIRLNKKQGDNWIPSNSIKITFTGQTLPRGILICDYDYHRVRPYIGLPLQCYRCQRPNHTALSCTNKMRCLICSLEHDKKDCPNERTPKCSNCKGAHKANSNECPVYSEAKAIEKKRTLDRITYVEAREAVRQSNPIPVQVNGGSNSPLGGRGGSISSRGFRRGSSFPFGAGRGSPSPPGVGRGSDFPFGAGGGSNSSYRDTLVGVFDQTPQVESVTSKKANDIDTDLLIEKMKKCFTSIIQSFFPKENLEEIGKTIDSVLQKEFHDIYNPEPPSKGVVRGRSTDSSSSAQSTNSVAMSLPEIHTETDKIRELRPPKRPKRPKKVSK